MPDAAGLLAAYAALPARRQPAWGLQEAHGLRARAHAECVAAWAPLLQALPGEGPLRILDVGCAQGYYALAAAHLLTAAGRTVGVLGLDADADNVRFCEALAAYHGIDARFVCATFDADWVQSQAASGWNAVLMLGETSSATGGEGAASEGLVKLLRSHARVALCVVNEAMITSAEEAAPDTLGACVAAACAFDRRLGAFGSRRRPRTALAVHVCSDHLAWVGDRWFAFERVADRSHPGVPDAFAGQRRFFLGAGAVVKAFRGAGRYGDFNRAELAAEAEILQALPDEPDRFPALLARADDGDMVWLARGALPGKLLSERVAAGGLDADAVARALLGELAHLESLGFYHADLRCWNCLVDGPAVRLIDFGALVRDPSPLQRLALAAVLLELATGGSAHEEPYYASPHPLDAYPAPWRPLVRYVLGTPQRGFSYRAALDVLVAPQPPGADAVVGAAGWGIADDVLAAAADAHAQSFRRLREHGQAAEDALAAERRAHAAELAEVRLLRARARDLEQARADAEQQHAAYAGSLKAELEKSQAHATSLEARLARVDAEARAEREALEAARDAAVGYSNSLGESLQRSRTYVESLKEALATSQAYASSLEGRAAREAADARAEREALQASQRDAVARADALERALGESQTYANTLAAALSESQTYASGLETRIEREAAERAAERAALEHARGDAATYAESLKASLEESHAYADSLQVRIEREAADRAAERAALEHARGDAATYAESLKASLEESHAYADSLQARIERETADTAAARAAWRASEHESAAQADALKRSLAELRQRADALDAALGRMQGRFRWLKPLWPGDPEAQAASK